jgi:hypothetical protein
VALPGGSGLPLDFAGKAFLLLLLKLPSGLYLNCSTPKDGQDGYRPPSLVPLTDVSFPLALPSEFSFTDAGTTRQQDRLKGNVTFHRIPNEAENHVSEYNLYWGRFGNANGGTSIAPDNVRAHFHTEEHAGKGMFHKETDLPIFVFTTRGNVLGNVYDANVLVPLKTTQQNITFEMNVVVPDSRPTHLVLCPSNGNTGESPLLQCAATPIIRNGHVLVLAGAAVSPKHLRPDQRTDPIKIMVSRLPNFGEILVVDVQVRAPVASILDEVDDSVDFNVSPVVSVYPSTLYFTSLDDTNEQSFRIFARRPGEVEIHFLLRVESIDDTESVGADAYVAASPLTLEVHEYTRLPPTPKIVSARFNRDGTTVDVLFDSPTDRGMFRVAGCALENFPCLLPPIFNCATFLSFRRVPAFPLTTCAWISDSHLEIRMSSKATAEPGTTFNLKKDTISAKCHVSSQLEARAIGTIYNFVPTVERCALFPHMKAKSFSLAAPLLPLYPSPVLTGRHTLGLCDSVRIDATCSIGTGGRKLSAIEWEIETVEVRGWGGDTPREPRCTTLLKHNDCPLAGAGDRSDPVVLAASGILSGTACQQRCEDSDVVGCCEWQVEWGKCIVVPGVTAIAVSNSDRYASCCTLLAQGPEPEIVSITPRRPHVFSTSGGCGFDRCSKLGWSASSLANFTQSDLSGLVDIEIPHNFFAVLVREYMVLREVEPSSMAPVTILTTFTVKASLTNFLGRTVSERFVVEQTGTITSQDFCSEDAITQGLLQRCDLELKNPSHVSISLTQTLILAASEPVDIAVANDFAGHIWIWKFTRSLDNVQIEEYYTSGPILRLPADSIGTGLFSVTVEPQLKNITESPSCTSAPIHVTVRPDNDGREIDIQWSTVAAEGVIFFSAVGNTTNAIMEWKCVHLSRMRPCNASGVKFIASNDDDGTTLPHASIIAESLEVGNFRNAYEVSLTVSPTDVVGGGALAHRSIRFVVANRPWSSNNVIALVEVTLASNIVNPNDNLLLPPRLEQNLELYYQEYNDTVPHKRGWEVHSGITHVNNYADSILSSSTLNLTIFDAKDSVHTFPPSFLKLRSQNMLATGPFTFRELVNFEDIRGTTVAHDIIVQVNTPPSGRLHVVAVEGFGAVDSNLPLQNFNIWCAHCEDQHMPVLFSYDWVDDGMIPLLSQVPYNTITVSLPMGTFRHRNNPNNICNTRSSVEVHMRVKDGLGAEAVFVQLDVEPAILAGRIVSNATIVSEIDLLLDAIGIHSGALQSKDPNFHIQVSSIANALYWVYNTISYNVTDSASQCMEKVSMEVKSRLLQRVIAEKDQLLAVFLSTTIDARLSSEVQIGIEARLATISRLSILPTLVLPQHTGWLERLLEEAHSLVLRYHQYDPAEEYRKLSLSSPFEKNMFLTLQNLVSFFEVCSPPDPAFVKRYKMWLRIVCCLLLFVITKDTLFPLPLVSINRPQTSHPTHLKIAKVCCVYRHL